MKKNEQVYDNIKFKTPMRRMMEEQEAKRKAIAEKEAKEKAPTSSRKTKEAE